MKIAVGCDEAAYELKLKVIEHLKELGHDVVDCGCDGSPVNYPDIAVETCSHITSGECERGVLLCGTGLGMCMTANKVPGIRAAVCHDPFSAQRSILSNDAQVCCMGARVIAPQLALCLLDIWLPLHFKEGHSSEKIACMMRHEKELRA